MTENYLEIPLFFPLPLRERVRVRGSAASAAHKPYDAQTRFRTPAFAGVTGG
jgi:hypothetical protein